MNEIEFLVESRCALGEGPLWHPEEQVLYWLDIMGKDLHRFDPSTGEHTVTGLGVMASAMGARRDGSFVMATSQGFAFWDPRQKAFTPIANPDPDQTDDARFNDGKTDPQGRFWAGKMSNVSSNSLFRLNPDLSIERMENGIGISNGLGWSPDAHRFYFTDTAANTIYVFDFDPGSGAIANRRVFARVPDTQGEGYPDGLAVDSQGFVWSARWRGWKIVRYDPDGKIEREVPLPAEFVTSCTFGGSQLDVLYITTASAEVAAERQTGQPHAGGIFRLHTRVSGLPEPLFKG